MQEKKDGSVYAPKGRAQAVCSPGDFPVGVIGLDHGHIFGMCNGLTEAGAEVVCVYDPDPAKVAAFRERFPGAAAAVSREEVLSAPVQMIATAAVPCDRAGVALAALAHGKHVFIDKPAMTTAEQIDALRRETERTGKRVFVYYSERLHVEASVYAEKLIREGAVGRVVQVMGWGPHRLSEPSRPAWFFEPERYGGILTDIGCHQIEQLMFFAGAKDARIIRSRVGNYAHPKHPAFQDFGDCMIECDNGVTGYFRVDWFTPDGMGAWGDGRTLITGTDGMIEIRKYIDLANSAEGDHVYFADRAGEHHLCVSGQCGFPFFGRMIRDCLDGSDTAMDQAYTFRVMELAIEAQQRAERCSWTEG